MGFLSPTPSFSGVPVPPFLAVGLGDIPIRDYRSIAPGDYPTEATSFGTPKGWAWPPICPAISHRGPGKAVADGAAPF